MTSRQAALALTCLLACSKNTPAEPAPSGSSVPNAQGAPSAPVTSIPPIYAPGTSPMGQTAQPPAEDLAWAVPVSWTTLPNPNTMRKATYKIARGPSDSEDAELAVSQAGGALEDNIKRWEQQFEGAPASKRSERKVAGLTVTVVEIQGVYLGSGMGPSAAKRPGTTMLAAIVSTDPAHFFKLVGPTNTVNLAKPDFDKLLASLKKK